jgi:hypothetical protein
LRKLLLLASLAAVAVASFAIMASSAGARTETRFSVLEIQKSQHKVGPTTIISRGRLVNLADRDDVVGHDVVKISFHPKSRTARVRAIGYFRGQGSLKVKGRITGGKTNRIPIIGGTGAFNGAAGKLKVRNLSSRRTLLTFIFVQ